MIDEVDLKLKDWVGTVAQAAPVSFEVPGTQREGAGVGLYLLELGAEPPPRGRTRGPLQIQARYLVTTWAPDARQEHKLLGDLVFAALERDDFDVDLTPPDAELWSALGIKPRPCFVLQVPVRKERPEPKAPRVTQAMVTRTVPSVPLLGRVVGPGDFPLAGALVELPAQDLITEADSNGWFRFRRVIADPRPRVIRVRAKGEIRSFTVEPDAAANEPVIIRFPLED